MSDEAPSQRTDRVLLAVSDLMAKHNADHELAYIFLVGFRDDGRGGGHMGLISDLDHKSIVAVLRDLLERADP